MDTNLSFYAIPIAWALCLVPHAYAHFLYETKSSSKADNRKPRSFVASLDQNQSLDKATKDTISRAEAAQQNGFESIGFFAAAVVAGNVAGLEPTLLNGLAYGYIASRVLYNVVYVNNTSQALAAGRSVIWMSGIGCCFGLFIFAGNKLRQ